MDRARLALGLALLAAILGGGMFAVAGPLDTHPLVMRWFGPPQQQMREAYAEDSARASFDHSAFDRVVKAHVKDGLVDYDALAEDRGDLDVYVAQLGTAPFDELDRDGKLALLINAYNAWTLVLILDHLPLNSIQDIPAKKRWEAERWTLGGRALSLSQLEHDELRAKFIDPRIHFAINCASIGCPPLRGEAYVAERLDTQLEDTTRKMHADPRWLRIDADARTVHLTKLYAWYATDFAQVAGEPLAFAARYRPALAEGEWDIRWLDYDWSLNRAP